MPLLSIITINLNNKEGLQKTIESIVHQTFNDYEYLIIDGGSTDGSVDIIKNNTNVISYWISETDKGIYNAMNKGIHRATGEYCLFLNSGDYLYNEKVLQNVFSTERTQDLLYGNILMDDNNSAPYLKICPDKLTFEFLLYDYIPHQCIFFKRHLFQTIGLYNENLKIVSDDAFFILAVAHYNCSYTHLPITISVFNKEGISSDPENQQIIKDERAEFFQKYFSFIINDYKELISARHELDNLKTSKFFKYGYKWSQYIKHKFNSFSKKNK
jgi:glycosyltransferase involved in cell wall biosynthesis